MKVSSTYMYVCTSIHVQNPDWDDNAFSTQCLSCIDIPFQQIFLHQFLRASLLLPILIMTCDQQAFGNREDSIGQFPMLNFRSCSSSLPSV